MSVNQDIIKYRSRKDTIVVQSITEPIEFLALDWYECDLVADI